MSSERLPTATAGAGVAALRINAGEAVAVALSLAVALALVAAPGPAATIAGLTLQGVAIGLVAAWIARQDLSDFTIPDGGIVALLALGTASRVVDAAHFGESLSWLTAAMALDLLLCGGLLLVVREVYFQRRGHDGLGFGDIKLAAAGGVLAGTEGFTWALFGASLAGLVLVAAARTRRPEGRTFDKLAFGALLAPALWLAWLVGQVPRLSDLTSG